MNTTLFSTATLGQQYLPTLILLLASLRLGWRYLDDKDIRVWRFRLAGSRDSAMPRRRRPVLLAIVVAATLLTASFEVRFELRERTYAHIASELAGRPVNVHCQRLLASLINVSDVGGFVPFNPDGTPTNDAFLRRDMCQGLASVLDDPSVATPDGLLAIHVLTHEAMHLAGTANEAIAECMAMQREDITARGLGMTSSAAARVGGAYYRSRYASMPSAYRSDECRPGGALDEGLPDPPWGRIGQAALPGGY